jgi:hypothetical protein
MIGRTVNSDLETMWKEAVFKKSQKGEDLHFALEK